MLDAATFFGKFKGRGLLLAASWAPADGGAGASFEARLMKANGSGIPMIGGEELSLQFVAADAPGLGQNELVTLAGKTYRLRDRDRMNCSADGSLLAYFIREAVAA